MDESQHLQFSDMGDSELFCEFTTPIQLQPLSRKHLVSIKLYTRPWTDAASAANQDIRLPGTLARLPPEVRHMIYDYLLPTQAEFAIHTPAIRPPQASA